jgi:hypothetical protein
VGSALPGGSPWTSWLALLVWLSALLCSHVDTPARAQEPLTAPLRAAIVLRAVRYERNFASSSEAADVVVVHPSGNLGRAQSMRRAFDALGERGVAGRPLNVQLAVEGVLLSSQARLIHLAQGVAANSVPGIQGTIVSCDDPSLPAPCMLSVELHGSSRRMVLHLARARAMGLRFDARLLAMARVVE